MDKKDKELDAAILSQDTERLKGWLTEYAETLTWVQANKLVPVINAFINVNEEVSEDLLRVVAPIMGAYFTSHNNSLDGMNPVLVKFISHLQFRLTQSFNRKTRLEGLLSGNQSGGTVLEDAEEVADLFRAKRNITNHYNLHTLAKAIPSSRASRVLAVLEVAAMLAPEIQDIKDLRYRVWSFNYSALIMRGEAKPPVFLGSPGSWEEPSE